MSDAFMYDNSYFNVPSKGEIFVGVIYQMIFPVVFLCVFAHLFWFRQDFFTIERTSIEHLRKKNVINHMYKLNAFLKTTSIVCFGLTTLCNAIWRNFWPLDKDCTSITVVSNIFWIIALVTNYSGYILQLKSCYGDPPFGYKTSNLKIVAGFIIAIGLAILIGILVNVVSDGEKVGDIDGAFPYSCSVKILTPWKVYVIGLSIILWNLGCSVGSIVAFTVRFNIMKAAAEKAKNENEELYKKSYQKVLYTGYKYKVIVICSSVFELIWISLLMTGSLYIAGAFAALNWLVTILCLMLMTPYLPNDKWFGRLCCLCILCDRDLYKYTSTASQQHKHEESIDTNYAMFAQLAKAAATVDHAEDEKKERTNITDENNKEVETELQSTNS